jgi:hypothetical protein
LVGGRNPVQTPQTDVKISLPTVPDSYGFFLPFLGDLQKINGAQADGRTTFALPPISKGAVFWYGAAAEVSVDRTPSDPMSK